MESNKRPKGLTILLVLTFILTFSSLLASISSLISGKPSAEYIEEERVKTAETIAELKQNGLDSLVDVIQKMQTMTEEVYMNYTLSLVITIMVSLLGLAAILFMFQGFKKGFNLYIVYCLFSVISSYFYVSPVNIPTFLIVFNLLISGLFIYMYSKYLWWMKR